MIFTLQTPSQADDIRDFQIEGMSIGDSLQNYIDNNKFKYYEAADYFKDNKITLYETELSDFQEDESEYYHNYTSGPSMYYLSEEENSLNTEHKFNIKIEHSSSSKGLVSSGVCAVSCDVQVKRNCEWKEASFLLWTFRNGCSEIERFAR